MEPKTNFAGNNVIGRSLSYFVSSVVHPRRVFSLLEQETSIAPGFILAAAKWGLCWFYVYYLYRTNQALFVQPWLNIPAEKYHYYQLFFYVPYGLLTWMIGAGITQTLSQAVGGKGSFTSTLNIMGIIVFTPFVFIDSIDTLYFFFNHGNWSIVFNSITRMLFVIWSASLLFNGLNLIHRLSAIKAMVVTAVSVAIGTFINIIFIR